MNLQDRKIQLAQSMLRLNDEQIVVSLETLLKKLRFRTIENEFKPMSIQELNDRIQQSEDDFDNGRFISARKLRKKF